MKFSDTEITIKKITTKEGLENILKNTYFSLKNAHNSKTYSDMKTFVSKDIKQSIQNIEDYTNKISQKSWALLGTGIATRFLIGIPYKVLAAKMVLEPSKAMETLPAFSFWYVTAVAFSPAYYYSIAILLKKIIKEGKDKNEILAKAHKFINKKYTHIKTKTLDFAEDYF